MEEIILAIVSISLVVLGILGSILPILPATPLSLLGIILFKFTSYANYSWGWILFFALLTIISIALGYIIPIYGTKKFGGTKYGNYGAMAGLVVGAIFFSPFGIILGPIVGAFVGELIQNKDNVKGAFRAALGSFIGFLLSTGINILISAAMLVLIISTTTW